jgi:hypothetical protein
MFKKSPNPKVEELNKSWTKRSYNLGGLRAITRDLLRYCAWCGEGRLHHGNQKYCTSECGDMAMAWSYPQKEQGLYYLLQRQDFKCALCQYDYVPLLDMIVEAWNSRGGFFEPWDYRNKFSWHHVKNLKHKTPKERRLEVDHIIPIYKGGQSLGLDNHQAICYSCHKTKTSTDLKGKRK